MHAIKKNRVASPCPDREGNTPETSFVQGITTCIVVSDNVDGITDWISGSGLFEPSQISDEIEVFLQRLA